MIAAIKVKIKDTILERHEGESDEHLNITNTVENIKVQFYHAEYQ